MKMNNRRLKIKVHYILYSFPSSAFSSCRGFLVVIVVSVVVVSVLLLLTQTKEDGSNSPTWDITLPLIHQLLFTPKILSLKVRFK